MEFGLENKEAVPAAPGYDFDIRELHSGRSTDSRTAELLHSSRADDNSVIQFVKDHPLEIVAAGAGIVLLGSRLAGRVFKKGAGEIVQPAELIASNGAEFKAGKGVLKTIEGATIPDVERPFLTNLIDNSQTITKAREGYAGDLIRLWSMPKTETALENETLGAFAERILKQRAKITAERVNPESIAKETDRIYSLNEGITSKQLVTMNDAHFKKLAEDLQFKHVPQIGQFLKATGKVTEEQIETALKIQRSLPPEAPRKLLGEILVENKLALKQDVDLAFASQQELKEVLKALRTKFFALTIPG